jgi:hypothetical protein
MRMTAALGAILAAALLAGCVHLNPGDGEKVGRIVRLNHRGIVCQTWEAEAIVGGLSRGSGVTQGRSFYFTVEPEMVKAAQEAMRTQAEVNITLSYPGVFHPCRTDSGVFLVSLRHTGDRE